MKQPFLEETHNKPAPWSKGGSHLCEAERPASLVAGPEAGYSQCNCCFILMMLLDLTH